MTTEEKSITKAQFPLQIGITGGIGTGKSTVCRIFKVLGIPVYEADSRSKWLLDNHSVLKQELTAAFGEKAYENGKYNRQYLAQVFFKDKSQLERINKIIHPRVFEDYQEWVQQNITQPYVLREAAILFESGGAKLSDKIIVVSAPLELRIKRVLKRDTFRTEAELKAIIHKQMPEEEKLRLADFVIYNDDTQLVTPQVLALHEKFIQRRFV
jgi:dephospho-CoA kinase